MHCGGYEQLSRSTLGKVFVGHSKESMSVVDKKTCREWCMFYVWLPYQVLGTVAIDSARCATVFPNPQKCIHYFNVIICKGLHSEHHWTRSSFTKGKESSKASVLQSECTACSEYWLQWFSVTSGLCGVLCFLSGNCRLQLIVPCRRFWKTFRTSLDDLDLSDSLSSVVIRSHQCGDAIDIIQLAMKIYVFSVLQHQI